MNLNPVPGTWTEWSAVGVCSANCGPGVQQYTRSCTDPAAACGGPGCDGNITKQEPCNAGDCPACIHNGVGYDIGDIIIGYPGDDDCNNWYVTFNIYKLRGGNYIPTCNDFLCWEHAAEHITARVFFGSNTMRNVLIM